MGEIDAIGARNGTAILISCKNMLYTLKYDQGAYQTVRNVRTRLEDAEKQWDKLVADITSSPRGSNYDFTGYNRVVGVVITPQPYYVTEPLLSRRALDGLRFYSSFEELRSWYRG